MDELKAAVAEWMRLGGIENVDRVSYMNSLLGVVIAATVLVQREEEKRLGMDIEAEHV
jgi:hypothetical protein